MPLTGPDFATGSEVRVTYAEEAAFGVVPTSPAFKTARVTGGPGLRTNKVTGTSDELQPDRNIRDQFQLGQDVTGSYPTELTYGGWIDDWLEASLMGTWTNNLLVNASVRRSFTFEQSFLPNGTIIAEHRFAGCKFDGFTLALQSRQKGSLVWTLMGQREFDDTANLAGATYVAPSTSPVMTASGSVGALALGAGGVAPVSSINLAATNHLYTRPEVGTLFSDELGEGRFDLTGTMEVYFRDNTLYQQALSDQHSSLSFTIGNAAGSRYTFAMTNIKLGNMDLPLVANDQDLKLSLPFRGLFDPATGATLSVTRAV